MEDYIKIEKIGEGMIKLSGCWLFIIMNINDVVLIKICNVMFIFRILLVCLKFRRNICPPAKEPDGSCIYILLLQQGHTA